MRNLRKYVRPYFFLVRHFFHFHTLRTTHRADLGGRSRRMGAAARGLLERRQARRVVRADDWRVVHGRLDRVLGKGSALEVALDARDEAAEGSAPGMAPARLVSENASKAACGVVAVAIARLAAAAAVVAELAVVAQVAPSPVTAEERTPRKGVQTDVCARAAELQRRFDERGAENASEHIRLREQREVE